MEKHTDVGYETNCSVEKLVGLILSFQPNFKGPICEKTIQFFSAREEFDLATENMNNFEEAKDRIAHCVHSDGKISKFMINLFIVINSIQ